ncbi:MAG: hypothetical protein L0I73_10500, partial [Lactococcus lactis]|nr:hypothetical protein [Lactococcus lactis]
MNKIISIKQKFLCKDCEYILEISRLKVKKAKQYGGVYCPRCGKKIMDNEIKKKFRIISKLFLYLSGFCLFIIFANICKSCSVSSTV